MPSTLDPTVLLRLAGGLTTAANAAVTANAEAAAANAAVASANAQQSQAQTDSQSSHAALTAAANDLIGYVQSGVDPSAPVSTAPADESGSTNPTAGATAASTGAVSA